MSLGKSGDGFITDFITRLPGGRGALPAEKNCESHMLVEEVIYIQNKLGIHARPAALLVQEASKYTSKIEFEVDGTRVNGKSIMGVMMLAAAHGSRMTVVASGDDAEVAVQGIRALIASKFDEE